MTHELYKQTLLGGEVVRLLNTRIASSNHRLHTIVVNKKSLSGYDDKRFILSDQVSTLPYGHNSLREDMFYKTILDEPDWGSLDASQNEQESTQQAQDSSQQVQDSSQQARDSSQQVQDSSQQVQDSSQQMQDSTQQAQESGQQVKNKNQQKNKRQTQQSANVPQTNSILNTSFNSIPDPGFHQRSYSEDELNQNLVDFDNLSEFSDSGSSTDPACDGFILDQAIESDNASVSSENQVTLSAPKSKKRKQNAKKGAAKKPRARIIDYSSTDED